MRLRKAIKRLLLPPKRKIAYIFHSDKTINEYPVNFQSRKKRIIDSVNENFRSEEIILTTYFSSKPDPQVCNFVANNDFEYIRLFYESVKKQNLSAVIFHDNLDDKFIEKYSCEEIVFIRCRLLKYSLNDERFFIYREFLENIRFSKVLLCDVNDVTFGANPFEFMKKGVFYIGKDVKKLIGGINWIRNRIRTLPDWLKNKLPPVFYSMPIVNAGVIGGDYNTIKQFLSDLTYLIQEIDNTHNNNMLAVNIVFFDRYWQSKLKSLKFRMTLFSPMGEYRVSKKNYYSDSFFHVGSPLVSNFKEYEKNTGKYIYHK